MGDASNARLEARFVEPPLLGSRTSPLLSDQYPLWVESTRSADAAVSASA
jgi:hypothetical protein